ncbi:Rab geranylgeranyltransferase [Trapelia coarctata]|nr:Rab geranylgeranyltransferase [Trapelia coarctata]
MASHGVPRVSEFEPRAEQAREKELQKIEEYKDLVDLLQSKINERQYTAEVLQLTTKLLTLNPEYYTIWNQRRRILQDLFAPSPPLEETHESPATTGQEKAPEPPAREDILSLLSNDLAFVFSLLRKFPKCYWIWNHRLWLLKRGSLHLPRSSIRDLWKGELSLVGKMLTLDNRNFHGWGYRQRVVEVLESEELSPGPDGKGTSMVKEEFDYTTRMIRTSMSNFSAWHRRSKLIPRLLDEANSSDVERETMLNDELTMIQEALYTDSHDQSLWFYHQYLMCTFDPALASQSMAPNLTPKERLEYIESEMEKLIEMLEDDDESKWIYQSLIQLTMLFKRCAGRLPTQVGSLLEWMASLRKLDPLRRGRWEDLEKGFGLDG